MALQKRVSGTAGDVEPNQTAFIYIQVRRSEQGADMTWHGSWFHEWGLAGPPPQPRDPGVKMLCSVSGMKVVGKTCDSGLCFKSWILRFTQDKGRAKWELITWGDRWRIHVGVKKTVCIRKESDFHISRHMIELQYIIFILRFIWKQVLLLWLSCQAMKEHSVSSL